MIIVALVLRGYVLRQTRSHALNRRARPAHVMFAPATVEAPATGSIAPRPARVDLSSRDADTDRYYYQGRLRWATHVRRSNDELYAGVAKTWAVSDSTLVN